MRRSTRADPDRAQTTHLNPPTPAKRTLPGGRRRTTQQPHGMFPTAATAGYHSHLPRARTETRTMDSSALLQDLRRHCGADPPPAA